MSARRADYFRLALIGDDSAAFAEVYRSLRFSTHCQLVVISDRAPDAAAPWVAWKTLDNAQEALALQRDADLVLSVTGGECAVLPAPFAAPLVHQLPVVAGRLHEALVRAATDLDAALDAAWSLSGISAQPGFVRLDYFRIHSGDVVFTGASCSPDRCAWLPLARDATPELVATLHAALSPLSFVGSISCEIRRQSTGAYSLASLDRACHHWSAYRAVGVNIPLLYIQDFLQRRFEIFHFVDHEHLRIVDGVALKYCFDVKHVFVDLDETLIIDNRRVDYVSSFLDRCAAAGCGISIVSRHEHDIAATLTRSGIDPAMFENIHAVEKGVLKSSQVVNCDGAIFIDNEFAERLDVRRRARIPVLDTNQLDFLAVSTDAGGV